MNDTSSTPLDHRSLPHSRSGSNFGSGLDAVATPSPIPAPIPLPVIYKPPGEPPVPLAVSVTAIHESSSSPEAQQRKHLLHEVQQQREQLIDVAQRLRAPVQTLQTAQRAISFTVRSVRWIPLAVNVFSILMWLKSGRRRPPLTLIIGASMQLADIWSDLNKRPTPRALPHPREAWRPESRMRLPGNSPP